MKKQVDVRAVDAAKHLADEGMKLFPIVGDVNGLNPEFFPKETMINVDACQGRSLRVDCFSPAHRILMWISYFIEKTEVVPFGLVRVGKSERSVVSCAMPELRHVVGHLQRTREMWRDGYCPRIALVLRTYDENLADLDDLCDVDFDPRVRRGLSMRPNDGQVLLEKHKRVNDFVSALRTELRSAAFREKDRNWRGKLNVRMRSAKAYLDKLFSTFSRLMVVRVDLYPKKFDANLLLNCPEKAAQMAGANPDKVIADVERLLNNRRHNKLFEHCVGYIVKIEYGRYRGWHAHAIFFYDGHLVQNDSFYSIAIGNYWTDVITNGEGAFWACNRAKSMTRYAVVGIGLIDHSDVTKRGVLVDVVVSYLAKSDLFVQSKSFSGQKLFRMGQPPKVGAVKRGRPRNPVQQGASHLQAAITQQPTNRI